MKYRHDIDGLRAVAVLVVVLFHLGITGFAGGYVGVDVFFVISGFLITGILVRQESEGTLRLRSFYQRRVRRLVPALVATVVATTVAASFVLLPYDMVAFARSAVGALLSLGNVVFFAEAGYWDTAAELKPLLHTWSLGVEEQFYLLWPALVIAVTRMRRQGSPVVVLGLVTAAGLVLGLGLHHVDPDAAFYLLPGRVHQFALGGLVAVVPRERLRRVAAGGRGAVLAATGLGLVLASTRLFDATTSFPGTAALVPTVGAALVVVGGAGGSGGAVRRLLELRPLTWLGRVSYALYLAHWPVIALYRYRTGQELDGLEQVGLAAASLALAVALHLGVERRFRAPSGGGREAAAPVATGGGAGPVLARPAGVGGTSVARRTVAVAGLAAVVLAHPWLGDGWSWRMPGALVSVDEIDHGQRERLQLVRRGCTLERLADDEDCRLEGRTRVLVLGNSHEPDGYNFLTGALQATGRTDVDLVSFGTVNGCDLVRGNDRWRARDRGCDRRLELLFEGGVVEQLDVLVYAANKPFHSGKVRLLGLVQDLVEQHPSLHVVTIGGYLNTEVPCPRLLNEFGTPRACADARHVNYWGAAPEREALYDEFMALTDTFVDRRALLCEDPDDVQTCRVQAETGAPVSWDQHHLSLDFALEAGARFAAVTDDPFFSGEPVEPQVHADGRGTRSPDS